MEAGVLEFMDWTEKRFRSMKYCDSPSENHLFSVPYGYTDPWKLVFWNSWTGRKKGFAV
jgi:hypothetical protein